MNANGREWESHNETVARQATGFLRTGYLFSDISVYSRLFAANGGLYAV